MSKQYQRSFEAKIDDVSRAERSVTAVINTATVDRYRTVIDPAGADWSNFAKAPTVLWEHGQDPTRGRLPIGHCSSIKKRAGTGEIIARTFFKNDDYSQFLFECYADGMTLRGWSIDFLPDERSTSPPTPDEVRRRPELANCMLMFRRWELTGYSAVSYAGNPEALTLAVERGLWVPDDVRRSLPPAKRVMGESSGQGGGYSTEQLASGRHIVKHGDEYWLYNEDKTKVLGKHATREEAEKQEEAIKAQEAAGRSLLANLPPLRGRTLEDVAAAVERRTKAQARGLVEEAIQDARDLAWGRV